MQASPRDSRDAFYMARKTRGVEIVESQGLKHLLEEFPDFLTRYTSEEHAFIE